MIFLFLDISSCKFVTHRCNRNALTRTKLLHNIQCSLKNHFKDQFFVAMTLTRASEGSQTHEDFDTLISYVR